VRRNQPLPLVVTAEMRFQAVVIVAGKQSMIGGVAWQDKSGLWHASIDYWWYGEADSRDQAIKNVIEVYCDPTKV